MAGLVIKHREGKAVINYDRVVSVEVSDQVKNRFPTVKVITDGHVFTFEGVYLARIDGDLYSRDLVNILIEDEERE